MTCPQPDSSLPGDCEAVYGSEPLFWIGYTYRYWHFLTGQASGDIGKICGADMMHTLYPSYHTLDCSQTIERILEAKECMISA